MPSFNPTLPILDGVPSAPGTSMASLRIGTFTKLDDHPLVTKFVPSLNALYVTTLYVFPQINLIFTGAYQATAWLSFSLEDNRLLARSSVWNTTVDLTQIQMDLPNAVIRGVIGRGLKFSGHIPGFLHWDILDPIAYPAFSSAQLQLQYIPRIMGPTFKCLLLRNIGNPKAEIALEFQRGS